MENEKPNGKGGYRRFCPSIHPSRCILRNTHGHRHLALLEFSTSATSTRAASTTDAFTTITDLPLSPLPWNETIPSPCNPPFMLQFPPSYHAVMPSKNPVPMANWPCRSCYSATRIGKGPLHPPHDISKHGLLLNEYIKNAFPLPFHQNK